jgi:hypothetical protein
MYHAIASGVIPPSKLTDVLLSDIFSSLLLLVNGGRATGCVTLGGGGTSADAGLIFDLSVSSWVTDEGSEL